VVFCPGSYGGIRVRKDDREESREGYKTEMDRIVSGRVEGERDGRIGLKWSV
jgi:hypothetical protein